MYKRLALTLVVLAWSGTEIVRGAPLIEVNVTDATGHPGASIGEWQGDDTVITDEYGNEYTLGELKSYMSGILPEVGENH